jgi:hypothetical protein
MRSVTLARDSIPTKRTNSRGRSALEVPQMRKSRFSEVSDRWRHQGIRVRREYQEAVRQTLHQHAHLGSLSGAAGSRLDREMK